MDIGSRRVAARAFCLTRRRAQAMPLKKILQAWRPGIATSAETGPKQCQTTLFPDKPLKALGDSSRDALDEIEGSNHFARDAPGEAISFIIPTFLQVRNRLVMRLHLLSRLELHAPFNTAIDFAGGITWLFGSSNASAATGASRRQVMLGDTCIESRSSGLGWTIVLVTEHVRRFVQPAFEITDAALDVCEIFPRWDCRFRID